MANEYVFVDEWDVAAPQDAVFRALTDARTYPEWWTPVYLEVEGDCEPAVGCTTKQHFKGRLPYTLWITSEIVAYNPPNSFATQVVGDLTGSGQWALTPRNGGVHIRWDWTVLADRPLLRYLTPVFRPIFRYNHNWSVQRAIEGLEPYLRARSGR
jgi:uncharacterized protein YndB with AHSA1/START domain